MERNEKIAKIRECKYFAKGDLIVFAVCIALVALFTLFAFGFRREEGNTVEVLSYGDRIAVLPLGEDAEYLYTVSGGSGSLARILGGSFDRDYKNGNLIVIENGTVRVEEADCPDRTCILMGAADSGEIICMPHGLTLKITGGLGGDA